MSQQSQVIFCDALVFGAAISRCRLRLLVVRKWGLKNCDALRGPQWKLDTALVFKINRYVSRQQS